MNENCHKFKKKYTTKFTMEIKEKINISLDKIREIIKTPHMKRTRSEVRLLQSYFCHNVEYFKKLLTDPDGKEKIPKIISVLSYESFQKDEHIIYFGEIGDKFYIILSGSVNLYKPFPKNVYMTLSEYASYLIEIRDVEKNMLKFSRVENYNTNIDNSRILDDYYRSKLKYLSKKVPIVIEEERFIVKLGPGMSFGEMALIKNETRNVNIIADEHCELMSIDKSDYRKIIKDIEEQKINSQIKSFKMDYPFFQEWPSNRCVRLLSCLNTEYYTSEDYVYKQSNIPDCIYLIKRGEFEVSANITISGYEKFVEYIHDSADSLISYMDNPDLWKEDTIQQKINASNEKNDFPFELKLPAITKIIVSHNIGGGNLNDEDKLSENKNSENFDLTEGNKEEDKIEKNDLIMRVNIKKLQAPQIFGFIEPFELKKRFCNIRCLTREGVVQKIPFIEFLQLLPKDKKNRFFLEKNIFENKKELIQQLKNGVLVKINFNNYKKGIKPDRVYPGRNRDNIIKKKGNIVKKSASMINLGICKKNFKYNNSCNSVDSENKKNDWPPLQLMEGREPLRHNKNKKNILTGFKRSLFHYNENKYKIINQILPIGPLSKICNSSMNNYKERGINYSASRLLEDNSCSTVLPTKSSLMPINEITRKQYFKLPSRSLMNKILHKNNINDSSFISKGNIGADFSLPSIGNKTGKKDSFLSNFLKNENT